MNTIGKHIMASRKKQSVTRDSLEKETKIKKVFIKAIEEEDWEKLPEFPVVAGFVKRISSALNLDVDQSAAMLRRDYPPKKLAVNPKPDVEQKFKWNPKLTFILGIVASFIFVAGYLVYQYTQYTSPPELTVDTPIDGQIVGGLLVPVSGLTDESATVRVNNQPVFVEEDGVFKTDIEVTKDTDIIVVRSIGRNGQETEVARNIVVQISE